MARKNADVERLEWEVAMLRRQINESRRDPGDIPVTGCGDSSCEVVAPSGMHTNGGCRCEERTLRRALRYYKRRALFLQETIACMRLGVQSEEAQDE